eukprot:scpid80737/ scgid9767/ 
MAEHVYSKEDYVGATGCETNTPEAVEPGSGKKELARVDAQKTNNNVNDKGCCRRQAQSIVTTRSFLLCRLPIAIQLAENLHFKNTRCSRKLFGVHARARSQLRSSLVRDA